MSEFQKPFTPAARENWNKIFCPYKYTLGEEFNMGVNCPVCENNNESTFESCREKHREYINDLKKKYPSAFNERK